MPASMLTHLRAFFAPAPSPPAPSVSPAQQQQQSAGQRTWSFRQYLVGFSGFQNFLQHATLRLQRFLHRLYSTAAMALRRDSAIAYDVVAASQRHMVHLKTKEECRLGNETIQVWTVELPSKYAEGILRVVKDTIPAQDAIDLQHLRRFAKPKFLPKHVVAAPNVLKNISTVSQTWSSKPASVMQAASSSGWEWPSSSRPRSNSRPQTLHLLICPTRCVGAKDLEALLLQHPPFCSSAEAWAYPLEIKEITVPLLAPTTVEKAALWSDQYWPTFYRKTNPFGAHPSAILKAEDELQCPMDDNLGVEEALELAEQVGETARKQGLGVGSGCVVMERVDGHAQVVAVAGDARFKPLAHADTIQPETGPCQGNIMGHVVMRVVGMVGRKRLRCASQTLTKAAAKAESNFTKGGLEHDVAARDAFFLDTPVLPVEEEYFEKDNLKPDGYLSLKLEVFLTHEPCMMCCMALVHSRVGRVIFKHRMPKTGGLTAELVSNDSGPVGLGYGLCWRKELNWQFMCWEYIPKNQEGTVLRTPAAKRGSRRGSSEKYTIAEDTQASSGADVTLSSFASIHV